MAPLCTAGMVSRGGGSGCRTGADGSTGSSALRETAAVRLRPARAAASVAIASGVVALALGAIGLYATGPCDAARCM